MTPRLTRPRRRPMAERIVAVMRPHDARPQLWASHRSNCGMFAGRVFESIPLEWWR